MADGEVTVRLDAATKRRLDAVAKAAGQPLDVYLADLIAERLGESRYAEAVQALEEHDRTGESRDAAEVMAEFRQRVAARAPRV